MEWIESWRDLPDRLRGAVTAMGAFDGVHLGHQAVIAEAAAVARRLAAPLAVLTFDPAPKAYFNPGLASERLMDADQFERALGALGVERIYLLPMKALSQLSSAAFARDVLSEGLAVRHVAVGFDNTFGRDRAGPDVMAAYGRDLGFTTSVTGEVSDDAGAKICSTAVRAALRRGAPHDATRALGRAFAIRGPVTETADGYDLRLDDYIAPRPGRYRVAARLASGERRPGEATILSGALRARLDGPLADVLETELLAFLGDAHSG